MTDIETTDVFSLPNRAVLRLSGPDARDFLHGLLTRSLANVTETTGAVAALQTPQGKILFEMLIVARGEALMLDVDAAHAEALAKRLKLYKLRAKVEIEDASDAWAVGWAPGGADGNDAYPDPRLRDLGARILAPRDTFSAADGQAQYNARRIALGVPEFGADYDPEQVFALDADLDALGGVDFKKGCFIGQEVTSRMKRKGEIRKRILTLAFDGAPPAPGTPVTAGDSTLGNVLSGVDGKALALIRLDRWAKAKETGAHISAGDTPVRICAPAWLGLPETPVV